ncbi:hypothetical protein KR038_007699, partial [Drosophila bunnanda]
KITVDDMMREYTPEEVRMLCERTKVRVQMNRMNSVWDAKMRFDKKKRLENKSERFVNRMIEKAHMRKMVQPYSDLEREKYKELATCLTKKDNNTRLDRWQHQRLRASKSSVLDRRSKGASAPINASFSSSSEPEPEAEMFTQLSTGSSESAPVPLEYQSQSTSDETTMDDVFQPVMQPPAPKPLPNQDSEPNLWGIGDHDELEESGVKGGPHAAVPETQLSAFDWQEAALHINSESLSMQTIVCTQNTEATASTQDTVESQPVCTQRTEPDYECFGTQVMAASTQDKES